MDELHLATFIENITKMIRIFNFLQLLLKETFTTSSFSGWYPVLSQVVHDYRTNLRHFLVALFNSPYNIESPQGATEGIEGPPAMQHALAQLKAHRVPMQERGVPRS